MLNSPVSEEAMTTPWTISRIDDVPLDCLSEYEEEGYCSPKWDSLLCWPRTKANSLAVQPCFDEFHGIRYDNSQNASKLCQENGTWESFSNFTQCRELDLYPLETGSGVEITTRIYFFGYGLSLVALIIAVIIYLYYRELRCLRNTIHKNLMFTYILADALWILTTVSQVSLQTNIPMCIIFYSLLHYFQLTNFFWMFVEGLYLYLLVVKTFSGDNIKLNLCLLIGWGVPFVVVLVWGVVRAVHNGYIIGGSQEALSRHCPWMVSHMYDWLFEAPAIGVICINVIFLSMIMWVLITKLRSHNNPETQQYWKATKALLVLIPLLGVTYILVLAGPTEGQAGSWFSYTRAALLSSQGFSVAVFYCFINSEVQQAIRQRYQRWSAERSLGAAGRRYYAQWAPHSRSESISLYYLSDCTTDHQPAGTSQPASSSQPAPISTPRKQH